MVLAGAGLRHLPSRRVQVNVQTNLSRPSRHCVSLTASAFSSWSNHQGAKPASNSQPSLLHIFLGLAPRAGLLGRSRFQLSFIAGGAAQALAGGQGPPAGGPSGGGSSGGGSGGDGSFSSCTAGGASNVLGDLASSESSDMVEEVILLDVGGKSSRDSSVLSPIRDTNWFTNHQGFSKPGAREPDKVCLNIICISCLCQIIPSSFGTLPG